MDVLLASYTLIRKNRLNKSEDGVAVYVKEGLHAKLLFSSSSQLRKTRVHFC